MSLYENEYKACSIADLLRLGLLFLRQDRRYPADTILRLPTETCK